MKYTCKRNADGEPLIEQGLVHGKRVTWNPDDALFYVHAPRNETLGRFKEWRNTVQYARRLSK